MSTMSPMVERELRECLAWMDRYITMGPRLPAEEGQADARAVIHRIREITGMAPERSQPPGEAAEPQRSRSRPQVSLAFQVRWLVDPDGTRRSLGLPQGRIMMALVERHEDACGAWLPVDALVEAGWPSERVTRGAGVNRVYVVITQLRRMGLRDVLESGKRGYRLSPLTVVRLVTPSPGGAVAAG